MSPELTVLDELLCYEELDLVFVRGLFNDDARFVRALTAMLDAGEIRVYVAGVEAPRWRWRELLASAGGAGTAGVRLALTEKGARRVR